MQRAGTRGELRRSGYQVLTVREEMRRNLLAKLAAGERILPGIVGFDDTVVPEIENAVLAGHHMVFLGERGQAKSRIIRALSLLLDPLVPVVRGCAINDDPLRPICKECRRRAAEDGDALAVDWIGPDHRYGEKLATPDVSIADLIGEIDPVKVAEGRYLADEETIHYGIVPRTNRGIFAVNELPDLTEKVQVGLFNLMEEKDVQIKGYKIRLPLDIVIVASANPEDYTSRGRIITPLKDRFDVQIRTHYPRTVADEIAIMEQELPPLDRFDRVLGVPQFMKEIVAQLTFEARACNEINQASGVSVRVTINNYESLISNAEKRAVRLGEREIVPRITDLHALAASTAGKIELEYAGEEKSGEELIERLLNRAVLKVFDRLLKVDNLKDVAEYFEKGWGVEVSDMMKAEEYLDGVKAIPGLREGIRILGGVESPGFIAAASEFILEGLHLHQKLNKDLEGGRYTYRA
ncbi:MAG TPA: magnesium chelatase [Candidatus Margulisiibacteriota bacterium]|nr:magnesium chelatase [Candidatus Margulisiibacteriota bacterium]